MRLLVIELIILIVIFFRPIFLSRGVGLTRFQLSVKLTQGIGCFLCVRIFLGFFCPLKV